MSAAWRGSAKRPTNSAPTQRAFVPAYPGREIRGLGNVLRHEYDRVEGSHLWYTIQDDLPPLKASVGATLRKLQQAE
ncbi:MAG: DUF86 domain-containing protein [Acidobacteriia bacterium]|nr:DUF86 domain-containing protein [Terriglobia bacterium]